MLTNPNNTLGLFEERIEEITEVLHSVGALVYYDGANLNAIMGKARPGDMGFDIVHINTHKTFATPGGEGRAPDRSGSQSTSSTTCPPPSLPATTTARSDGTTTAEIDRPAARLQRELQRARARLRLRLRPRRRRPHRGERAGGAERELPRDAHGSAFPLAYPGSPPMHEFVATAEPLKRATGVRALDVAKRDRPRVSPVDRVLPARRRRGDDGRADRDRVEADARRHGRGVPAGRGGGAHRPDLLHEAP